MFDSEGDIDDELLELAGATENKRKRQVSSKASSSKRRKADISVDTPSEDEPESEDDENLYPLEGKYVDEADRHRLMQMPEVEREDMLAQRLEEMQRMQDKRNLDQMLKAQNNRGADPDSVSKAAKRQHAIKGATKEKSRKLDELKARRKAKDEKKRASTRANSPRRDRSSSPMDMETSSDEEEDGQITRFEEEEEKDRKLFSKSNPEDEAITIEDLNKCRLTRDMLAKWCMSPWFEDYVKGAWVRYLIGTEGSQPVYRICEITNLGADLVKPYKVNDQTVNQSFELRHGKSARLFLMDKVSNTTFQPKEFERVVKVCQAEDVKMPSKRHLEKKSAQLIKLTTTPMTESDVAAVLARKSQLSVKQSPVVNKMEKSRLMQARTLAIRRQDAAEVEVIDAQLLELAAREEPGHARQEATTDMLAKVNERNRKANLEAVRKSELIEVERKRRERKLAAAHGGSGATTPSDPSARLKTLPRLFESSRPGTPSRNGTPLLQPQQVTNARSVSPMPLEKAKGKNFESSLIDSVEVNLVDF